ncbi:uncharacterized protein BDR25DRAFT_396019 [Lindgomyces ingoldianus]|uniref:Uncharacterized protein n=1 Tax=Lindgomyces ingoldianus TaxID=673940 RepID=A0ACB6QG09_9PLEO|nr:uncharacterized protein BDR25DRAFT_396019 [Lindgomyces ingoldianus]KAF2465913.1 hypothetical protein BDR25DRAFT_396019 [Lindgomyces ingoldianus]
MDPASAIIGLSASLTTLAGLVLESTKILYKAQGHFREAPRDISRLCWQLSEFEALVKEVQSQVDADCGARSSAIRTLMTTSAQNMLEDLQEFNIKVQQLGSILTGPATRRKRFGLRLRHVFTESKVAQYQQLISSYSGTLTLFLALSNKSFYRVKLEQLSKRNLTVSLNPNQKAPQRPRIAHKAPKYRGNSTGWKLQLPFGVTASSSTVFYNHEDRKPGLQASLNYRLTFIPPRWLSSLILQWEFRFNDEKSRFPALGVFLTPIRYNSDPRLIKAIKSCDAAQLRELFRSGIARADDYVLMRRRPVLLLEAMAPRSSSCDQERVLETYEYLLNAGYSTSGLTLAPSHTQILINLAKGSKKRLNSALNTFCSHDGSLFWSSHSEPLSERAGTEPASTILSLISRHGAGFGCLEEFIFRQSEPWMTEDLSIIDRWLIGILASVSNSFRNSLESYLQSYKCVFAAQRNNRFCLDAFDLATIVSEVAQAPNKARIELLKIIIKWGTKEMLHPFLSAGFVDLEESAANEMFPWLRLSYLSKAVKWNNKETFEYLLSLGACPIRGLAYMSRFPDSSPQETGNSQEQIRTMALKMVEYALSDDTNHLVNGEVGIDHDLLLALLLRTSNLRRYSQPVTGQLIQRLFNHNSDRIMDCSQSVQTIYILFALVLNLPSTVQHFLDQAATQKAKFCSTRDWTSTHNAFCPFDQVAPTFEGTSVALKCHPPLNTFTWVSLAVELGLPECLQVLLDSWTSSGPKSSTTETSYSNNLFNTERYSEFIYALNQSLLEIEGVQKHQNYPRTASRLYTWPCQIQQRQVEQREDEHIAKILKDTIQKLEKLLNVDSIASIGGSSDNEVSNGVKAARPSRTPKTPGSRRALGAGLIVSAASLLQLKVWEIVVLACFYMITLALFAVF